MAEPRISPGGAGPLARIATRISGHRSEVPPVNLFHTLGKHPSLFRDWMRFGGRLMPRGILPRTETELVILRVAHLRGSTYEFEHHARLGRRVGIGEAELARVVRGPDAAGWTDRQRAVLAAASALTRDHDIDDETFQVLRDYLDEREIIELCMLVGHYEMLATVIQALRIQPDRR
jgi:alkylhydroperoxidase family enzyme